MFVTRHPAFRPFPLTENPHVQTILPFFLRNDPTRSITYRYVVHLNDGDVLTIHDNTPQKWITGDRIVILVHGLCGSHQSAYMRRTAEKLRRRGYRTIRVDLRGQGDATLLSRGHASADSSADIAAVVRAVSQLSPLSPLSLVGFSLGGNSLLRLAGNWGANHPPEVDSIIAVSPPVDLFHASGYLRQWGNRLYDLYFTNSLTRHIEMRRREVRGMYDNGLKRFPDRLVHLDDQFIGPVAGFRGARDYYEHSSSGPLLRDVSLATLIVAAQDDPIVPASMYRNWVMSPDIEIVMLKQGGHLGFFGNTRGDPDRHWLEWRIARWIDDFAQHQTELHAQAARESKATTGSRAHAPGPHRHDRA